MGRIKVIAFCLGSLLASVAVFMLLFPAATMTLSEAEASQTAADMEDFDLINLGDDFGELTVFDLMGFYLDNPPKAPDAAQTTKKKHFGGC